MNRAGLLVALAIALVSGVVFTVFPKLDLELSKLFYDAETRQFFVSRYVYRDGNFWLLHVREAFMWIVAALVAPAVAALVVKAVRPRKPLLIPGRAVVFL